MERRSTKRSLVVGLRERRPVNSSIRQPAIIVAGYIFSQRTQMLTTEDFLALPYHADLSEAGVAYVLRSLAFGRSKLDPDFQRELAAVKSCELAFRRFLDAASLPYRLARVVDPLSPHILLDGRRCFFHIHLCTEKGRISRILHQPETLLDEAFQVEDFTAQEEEDLLIFGFALALVARGSEDSQKAAAGKLPLRLIYPLPEGWNHPGRLKTFQTLVLKSASAEPVEVEIGGLDGDLSYLVETFHLEPFSRRVCASKFHRPAFIMTDRLPTGRIGLHNRELAATILIEPGQWHNIWVYGMKIIFAGALTRSEMHKTDRERRTRERHIRKKGAEVRVPELNPLEVYYPVRG